MLMDERGEFADAVALNTGAPARFLIGDVIDIRALDSAGVVLGAANPDLGGGGGNPVYIVITVSTAIAQASGAVRFHVVTDSVAAIAVDGTATEHFTTHDFTAAELVAGARIVMPLPGRIPEYERFMGILQETITTALTAGAINAFITTDVGGAWKSYPDASN